MPAKEYNEMRMRGILPSDGMDAIPVTESTPLTSIDSYLWLWDTVNLIWVKGKCNALGEQVVAFDRPVTVTETAPLTSIQVEPKPNANPIPVGKIPDGGTQVAKDNWAINAAVLIHQVTAGTTLYLSAAQLEFYMDAASGGAVYISVTTSADVEQYRIFQLGGFCAAACVGKGVANNFIPPYEIPATYKVKIVSNALNVIGIGIIHGYEA